MIELKINHNKKIYIPAVLEDIKWSTERYGSPGTLNFSIMNDCEVSEGDAVSLKVDDKNLFYGFVFTIKRSNSESISITAYDQLRYFKNKTTESYSMTSSDLLKMLAEKFGLKLGKTQKTSFVIPSRIEDNKTLFDIMQTSLDLTLANTGNMFVLFDDFGKLNLQNVNDMKVSILIDAESAQSFDYSSSIDDKTYNQIKLYRENDSGARDVYIAKDTSNINKWGVLQLFESFDEGENGKFKANKLLQLYNAPTKSLSIKNCFGDNRVRAGSMVVVRLKSGDIDLNNWMLVESCTHNFRNGEHFMDLKLRGGKINV